MDMVSGLLMVLLLVFLYFRENVKAKRLTWNLLSQRRGGRGGVERDEMTGGIQAHALCIDTIAN